MLHQTSYHEGNIDGFFITQVISMSHKVSELSVYARCSKEILQMEVKGYAE